MCNTQFLVEIQKNIGMHQADVKGFKGAACNGLQVTVDGLQVAKSVLSRYNYKARLALYFD